MDDSILEQLVVNLSEQVKNRDALIDRIIFAMAEQTKTRNEQMNNLLNVITETNRVMAERGKESDDRMRIVNTMVHNLIDDYKNTHETYREHLEKLEKDHAEIKEEKQKLLTSLDRLVDRVEQAEMTNNQLLQMIKELAIQKAASNNININKR